jgi:acetylornithine aminotransferase
LIDLVDPSVAWEKVMLPNYATPKIAIRSASGSYVEDFSGKKYLDLLAGIAVSSIGHSHPRMVAAISDQASKFIHTSNIYAHAPGVELASKLLEMSGSNGKVLFTQDGATANEAALKIARRYGAAAGDNKQVIVAMQGGFHGRTFGALAVTGNPAKRDPFGPFGHEVRFVELGDFDGLAAAITADVSAVIIETIQGEGGIMVPPAGWMSRIRQLTESHQALLIADEVQSGIGRTGDWFQSIAEGVRPDIITLAKGLAGGMPLGAVIVESHVASLLNAGDHGTTFGGNPVSCAAALAVIAEIEEQNLLAHVTNLGEWFKQQILNLELEQVVEVRGKGLWLAIKFNKDLAAEFATAALQAGFLVNAVKPDAVRIAPPLNISKTELESFLKVFPALVNEVKNV